MQDLTLDEEDLFAEGLCVHCRGEILKVPNILEWVCQSNPEHRFVYQVTGQTTAAMLRCTNCQHEWFGEYNLEAQIAICPICVSEAQRVQT